MKTLKKLVLAVCFMVAVVLVLTSCGTEGKKGNVPAKSNSAFVLGEEPLEFSWYQNYDTYSAKPWAENNYIQEWLMKNKNVKINFIDAGGAAAEKLAVMIVSDDFPDVIQMDRGQDVDNLIKTSKVVPLNDYAKKYTNFYNDFKDNGVIELLSSNDKKWYQLPVWANYSGKPNGNEAWYLNKKIYEELGSPNIETFDDLYNYCKVVKSKFPNVIPYESGFSFTAESMIFGGMLEDNTPDYIKYFSYPKDGKLELIFKNPAYKESITFINKLFNEKLITQDAFTQTSDQVKEKWSKGSAAVMTGNVNDAYQGRTNMVTAGNDWITIKPLHKAGLDPSKITVQSYNMLGFNVCLITKNAKNPEAIYSLLDYSYSPEWQATTVYGPKGMYYDELDENKFPKLKETYFAKPADVIAKELGSWFGIANTSYVDACAMHVFDLTPPQNRGWVKTQQKNIIWKTSKNVTEFSNLIPSKNTNEGVIYQNLMDIYKEYRAKMVFAKDAAEVDSLFDKLISDFEKEGINDLLAYQQKIWDSNKQILSK